MTKFYTNPNLKHLEAFADDKINATRELIFVLGIVEKHGGKRKKCFSHHVFQMLLFSGSLKVVIVWLRV